MLIIRSEQIVVEVKVVVRILTSIFFLFFNQFKLFVEGIIRALPRFANIKEI